MQEAEVKEKHREEVVQVPEVRQEGAEGLSQEDPGTRDPRAQMVPGDKKACFVI